MIIMVLERFDFIVSIILFCTGLYAVIAESSLIKKVIGLALAESSCYLFFIAISDIRIGPLPSEWAHSPVITYPAGAATGEWAMVNPVPSAMVLTAIVVSTSIVILALSFVVKIHTLYGTTDSNELRELKG